MTVDAKPGSHGPRILVDSGDYSSGNVGDMAMLQVCVRRLRELWPSSSIEVLTQDPTALHSHCPGVKAVPWAGRHLWLGRGTLLGRFDRVFRPILSSNSDGVEHFLRRNSPALLAALIRGRLRVRGNSTDDLDAFLEAFNQADVVVLAGAGGFGDHATKWAIPALETLLLGALRGVPTAAFGQGMGPLSDSHVQRLLKDVLPRVSVVALREGLGGLPLLASLGIASDAVTVTGDDAIELAYELRSDAARTGTGINLRVATSANVDADVIEVIRPILHEFAINHDSRLVPLPITRNSNRLTATDASVIRRLLAGYDDSSDGGDSVSTPQQAVKDAGSCRIVVTGAYHAAVFALSQGIPVVALANSPFFAAKFLGLADQFGAGCAIVDLGGHNLPDRLRMAMERTWDSAECVREPLLEAARRQISLSRNAYRKLATLTRQHV